PGGIGITPIMSMLRSMAQRGDKRPILLFYANREWETVTFREEIAALEKKLNLKTVYVLEKPHPSWQGEGGFLNAAVIEKYLDKEWKKPQTHVFLCGPAPMMNAVEKAMNSIKFPEELIHSERFSL
ncbi:oxidoreductase, partial [bacterium]|nr:oxidoreductase [bacterium]